MIPRHPHKRIQIRRCLFATQFVFLATKILVSVLVTGDFISLMIQSVALLVFFGYVPWAMVCDFRTAKEVKLEWERIRKIRRGEDLDHVGESALEKKGKKNRWRSDRAWQECLFLTLQGICWLVSAIFAGIQGGPSACQQVVLQNAIISGLDRLVPDRAAAQFCNGMTANIALSCLGVVFTLLWLWWVCYSVKTLRKFEKVTQDGHEVLIVREKVWQKSMARLLRRDEDDDVNGIKRIVTGGMIDLVELDSRRASFSVHNGRERPRGFAVRANTPRPSHESMSSRTSMSDTIDIDHGHRRRGTPISITNGPGDTPEYERGSNDIIESLPRGNRSDMPPPPYIGQNAQANEGTYTTTSSGGTGTGTSISDTNRSPITNLNMAMLQRSGTIGSQTSPGRPLPLAPPQVDRVLERKMDRMASGSGSGSGGGNGVETTEMDAYTATRLGLGPVIASSGMIDGPKRTVEEIVDQKMDSYRNTSTSTAIPSAGPSVTPPAQRETMEQLVDRKIAWADSVSGPSRSNTAVASGIPRPIYSPTQTQSQSQSHSRPQSHNQIVTSPTQIHNTEQEYPRPPPTRIHAASYGTPSKYKGKSAEAGFTIENQSPVSSSGTNRDRDRSQSGEMSLEEMIELKMAALRAQTQTRGQDQQRPVPVSTTSGDPGRSGGNKKRNGKRRGRARAGSDPGPKLNKYEESDDDSGEG